MSKITKLTLERRENSLHSKWLLILQSKERSIIQRIEIVLDKERKAQKLIGTI